MADVGIPWNTGDEVLAAAKAKQFREQQKLSALGQLAAAPGEAISLYRSQAQQDQDLKDAEAIKQREQQTPEQAAATAAAAEAQAASTPPTNQSTDGSVQKAQPEHPVDQQSVGSVQQATPVHPTDTYDSGVQSTGTDTADAQSSKQQDGSKPAVPTTQSTENPGPPATKAGATPPPTGSADASVMERLGLFAKALPGKAYTGLGELAGSRVAHRIGDIFGVSDPWREEQHAKLAQLAGSEMAREREGKLMGQMGSMGIHPKDEAAYLHRLYPNTFPTLKPGEIDTYPPGFGKTAGQTQWGIRLMAANGDAAAAAAVKQFDDVAIYKSMPTVEKLWQDVMKQPTPAARKQYILQLKDLVDQHLAGTPEDPFMQMLSTRIQTVLPEMARDPNLWGDGPAVAGGGGGHSGGGSRPSDPKEDDPIPNTPQGGVDPLDTRFVAEENQFPNLKKHPGVLQGLVEEESGFDPHATSEKGAQGLTQFMPGTAAQYHLQDPYDANQSLHAAAQYLSDLIDKHGGDLHAALREYNGSGPTTEGYANRVEIRTKKYAKQRSGGANLAGVPPTQPKPAHPLGDLADSSKKAKPKEPPDLSTHTGPSRKKGKPPADLSTHDDKVSSLGPTIRDGLISSLQG